MVSVSSFVFKNNYSRQKATKDYRKELTGHIILKEFRKKHWK
jgi:hypothetical protein